MRKKINSVCLVLIILLLSGYGFSAVKKAPRFALLDSAGKLVFMSHLKGNLLVSFFASYCQPCRKELPSLVKYEKKYSREKDLKLVLISTDVSDETGKAKDKSQNVLDSIGIKKKFLLDSYQQTIARYNQKKSVPATFLINRKGYIVFSAIGAHKDTLINLERAIQNL